MACFSIFVPCRGVSLLRRKWKQIWSWRWALRILLSSCGSDLLTCECLQSGWWPWLSVEVCLCTRWHAFRTTVLCPRMTMEPQWRGRESDSQCFSTLFSILLAEDCNVSAKKSLTWSHDIALRLSNFLQCKPPQYGLVQHQAPLMTQYCPEFVCSEFGRLVFL